MRIIDFTSTAHAEPLPRQPGCYTVRILRPNLFIDTHEPMLAEYRGETAVRRPHGGVAGSQRKR
jgi:hypothetical protein